MADDKEDPEDQSPDLHQPMVSEARPQATSDKVAPALNPELLKPKQATPGRTRVLQPEKPAFEAPEGDKPAPAQASLTTAGEGLAGEPEAGDVDPTQSLQGGGYPTAGSASLGMGPRPDLQPSATRIAPLPEAERGPLRDIIARGSMEEGIDPAYAMATAERESSFNPSSGGTGTIRGMYQMSRGLRNQYGIGESNDAYVQTRGFGNFTNNLRTEMKGVLGRDPTWEETYAGHHFGGTRAARIINGQIDPRTPVQAVFTPLELQGNPHIVRAGTVGNLLNQTTSDMSRRMQRYGGAATAEAEPPDFSSFGVEPGVEAQPDLSTFGQEATP